MQRIRYLVGVVTLAATALAAWFLVRLLADDDRSGLFALRIEFRDVRGLRAGADVRYRGVRVGAVHDVRLGNDGERALVTILMDDGVEGLARQHSRFWIVVPRFGGLAGGATGLDTLVRDPYVAFVSPGASPPLPSGSLVAGLEGPIAAHDDSSLDPIRRGDLVMTLLAPETYDLAIGAEVRFRGLRAGEVRSIALAEDGTHVEIELLIHLRFRRVVTDATRFWIARPRLSGALLSGLAIEDLSALLAPFVSFHGAPGRGLPVPDGFRVTVSPERPEIDDHIPADAVQRAAPVAREPGDGGEFRLVRVIYEAEEEDWFSSNDVVTRTATGVLFSDASGRAVVATARSACDASYFMSDTFGADPDIASEAIRVELPGGEIIRAGRTWVEPSGADLALLVLESPPADLAVTQREKFSFVPTDGADGLAVLEFARTEPVPLQPASSPSIDDARGRIVLLEGRIVAILGQTKGRDETPRRIDIVLLPEELRPGS